jgi:glycosyltransferase involved in cell wall biosynthesis
MGVRSPRVADRAAPKSLSIVIPVYDEAATVEELLDRVWTAPTAGLERELVIVESNSKDGSREIVERWVAKKKAEKPGAVKLILQDKPRGKGNAMKAGFAAATGDIILIQDADLEYEVSDYPVVLEPILAGHADFVLGSRHLAAGTWKIRKFEDTPLRAFVYNFAGIFFHGFFNLLYDQELTDPTTMFKVFRRSCLEHIRIESDRFDFDLELAGKLIRSGYAPIEVPVSYASRGNAQGKKIQFVRDGARGMWAMAKYRFQKKP